MQSLNETVMLESFEFRKMYFATFGKMWNESEAPWHGSKKKKKKICCRLPHLIGCSETPTHTHIWLVVQRYTDYYYYCCSLSIMAIRVKWPCFYCPGRWNSYWRVVYAFFLCYQLMWQTSDKVLFQEIW